MPGVEPNESANGRKTDRCTSESPDANADTNVHDVETHMKYYGR